MVAFLSGNLAIRMDRLEVGHTHCTVYSTLMVAFLSGNLAIRMDRLEVQVAAAPTPFKRKKMWFRNRIYLLLAHSWF
jgi:hypothetical protein